METFDTVIVVAFGYKWINPQCVELEVNIWSWYMGRTIFNSKCPKVWDYRSIKCGSSTTGFFKRAYDASKSSI